MTYAGIKFYYWSTSVGCVIIFAEMVFAKYRGIILPSAIMCVIAVTLASALVGDWLVQNHIKHHTIE